MEKTKPYDLGIMYRREHAPEHLPDFAMVLGNAAPELAKAIARYDFAVARRLLAAARP